MKKRTKIVALLSTLACSALLIGATATLPKTNDVTASADTVILNDCEIAANGAIEAVGTIELSTEHVSQGSHSVKVTTTGGWAPLLIYLKKSGAPLTHADLEQLEYIEITIHNTNTEGMAFYFYNHNMGWVYGGDKTTTLRITGEEFLAQVDGGNKGTSFDPYNYSMGYAYFQIPNAGTIYIDNVVGVFKEDDTEAPDTDSMLNNCDVEWIRTSGSTALDATLKTEGNSSTRVTIPDANGGYISVKLMNNGEAITTEQLLGFDYLCLDINNLGSANRNLYLYNALATELVPGWNEVAIPMSVIKEQIDESAEADVHQFNDGWFYFGVYADSTLLFDNVRGLSEAELTGGKDEFGKAYYSAVSNADYDFVQYGATAVNTLTATQAAAKGLPTGYSDNVVEVVNENTTGKGVLLDFSSAQIPTSSVKSITFRLYFPDDSASSSYPAIRIHRTDESGDWIVNSNVKEHAGGWYDFTLLADGTNFNGSHNFSHMSANGYLDKFELGLRTGNSAPFYIDSISLSLTSDVEDNDSPIISYGGAKTIYTLAQEGKAFSLEATAHDRTEGALTVQYIWSDANAVSGDGSLKAGTYTLTLKAQDKAGNSDTMELSVIAIAPETNAPIITLPVDTITLTAGTTPNLIPHVADDSVAPVTITKTWSQGALDNAGKLLVGTHTYTITATDLSGNSASKTVLVNVISGSVVDGAIDDTQHLFDGTWLHDSNGHWKQCSCGEIAYQAVHEDNDNNHACDVCGLTVSQCADNSNDHNCDICGDKLSDCADNDNNHACDICGATLSDCKDDNTDGNCDICGANLGGNGDNEGDDNQGGNGDNEDDDNQGGNGDNEGDDNQGGNGDNEGDNNQSGNEHVYENVWQSNDSEHWKNCSCGEKIEKAAHVDANGDNKCDVCSHTIPTQQTPSANEQTADPEKKSGCKSAMSALVASGVALALCAVVKGKKKDE